MKKYELQPDEVLLYECDITCKTYNGSVKLVLTSQKIVIEKERGFFKKECEIVDIIMFEDIKIYNETVQIKQKSDMVDIQTIDKNLTFTFYNMIEARKFVGKIVDSITGTTLAKRSSNKIKGVFDIVDDTLGLDTRNTIKGVLENGVKGTILNGIRKKR